MVGAQEQKGEGHDRTRALTHSGVGAQELRPVLYPLCGRGTQAGGRTWEGPGN